MGRSSKFFVIEPDIYTHIPLPYISDRKYEVRRILQNTFITSLDRNKRKTVTLVLYKKIAKTNELSPSININTGLYGPVGFIIKESVSHTHPDINPRTGPYRKEPSAFAVKVKNTFKFSATGILIRNFIAMRSAMKSAASTNAFTLLSSAKLRRQYVPEKGVLKISFDGAFEIVLLIVFRSFHGKISACRKKQKKCGNFPHSKTRSPHKQKRLKDIMQWDARILPQALTCLSAFSSECQLPVHPALYAKFSTLPCVIVSCSAIHFNELFVNNAPV